MSIQLDICSVIQHAMPSVTEIAGNVPSTQMALQRWLAMEMRWNRNDVSLLSPEVADKRLPSLDRNWTPFTQIGPKVSKASGQNMYLWVKSMYFDSFLEAASSAAPPTVEEVDRIYYYYQPDILTYPKNVIQTQKWNASKLKQDLFSRWVYIHECWSFVELFK